MDDFSALLRKLEGLGVKPGAAHTIQTPAKKDTAKPIEELISGTFEKTHFGEVFTVSTNYTFPYQHGRLPLTPPSNFQNVWKWAKYGSKEPPLMKDIVFLDTETSGLSGGTGTLVFMIGLGVFNEQGFTVTQIFLRDPSEELAMLAVLARLTEKYTTVVSYNGKSFDIPMLRSRHVQNRFPFEMDNWNHIDILHLVRQVWRYSQESRTLKDMEVNVLDFIRGQEEVPGWMVPQLYFDYLQTRNAQPLTGVFYHNAIDIVSLAALFVASSQLLEYPFESGAIPKSEADSIALARIYENLANPDISAHLYAQGIANGLPDSLELPSILRYARLCKRNQRYSDAVLLWKKAVEKKSIEACIELAKYYEHQTNELEAACENTKTALSLLPNIPLFSVKQNKLDLQRRLERLTKKLEKRNNGNAHAKQ